MATARTKSLMEETNAYWQFYRKADIETECERGAMGKWMMYFPKTEIDRAWATLRDLYDGRKLTGISSMKVSTARPNPRASDHNVGVVILYCAPANDENVIMEYGRNLLRQFPYKDPFGYMYYKTDRQTDDGTRATGTTKNWTYRITVPIQDNDTVDGNKKPSETIEQPFLICRDKDIQEKYEYDDGDEGKWMMWFPMENIDEKWDMAKQAYLDGRLDDISWIKVTTANRPFNGKGLIMFHCGPEHDQQSIMQYGQNLLNRPSG